MYIIVVIQALIFSLFMLYLFVCLFVWQQKEQKVKVGRATDRRELLGSDLISSTDEQVRCTWAYSYSEYT